MSNSLLYTTELVTVNPDSIDSLSIERAATLIKQGECVVFPTETVYGLGANALDPLAVEKIFLAKGRPQDNPLIVHIASWEEIFPLVREVTPLAEKLATEFWPGPLTIVLERSERVGDSVTAGLDTVAIRMPAHPIALALIRASGVPIAAPSANVSGAPSPTQAQHAFSDLLGRVPLILDGGVSPIGVESTVVSFENGVPRILRFGAITPEQIRAVAGQVILPEKTDSFSLGSTPASPGLKYSHYKPNATVVLVEGTSEQFVNYCNQQSGNNLLAIAFEEEKKQLTIPVFSYGFVADGARQASQLFALLRKADEQHAELVLVHAPSRSGIGLAVYDRLLRAASYHVVTLAEDGVER